MALLHTHFLSFFFSGLLRLLVLSSHSFPSFVDTSVCLACTRTFASTFNPGFRSPRPFQGGLAHRLFLVTWFPSIETTYVRSVLSSFHVLILLSVFRAHMHTSLNLCFPVASLYGRRVCETLGILGDHFGLQRGNCLTCNSGSPTKRLLCVTDMTQNPRTCPF